MRLVLLGTTGYHPSDQRQTLSLLLPEVGVMLDAGTAVYRAGRYLATSTLDVFLTHAHLDHVIGLTYLYDVKYMHRLDRITVYGPAEKLAAIEQHLFSEALFPAPPPFESRPLPNQVALAGGGRLTHFPLEHPGGVLGYRLDWPDHSLAYVTDTTAAPDAAYVEKLGGVDLLVHECYFPDGHESWARQTGHSCTTPVAQVARQARVGRLLLVHLNPLSAEEDPIGLDVARAIFPATQLGHDLMQVEF